jgi:NADPH2:quinone reductase
LLVTYGTALHGLKDRAQLAAGETVAVLGAAGGAGVAAVEIAKLMGARVIAGASSQQKLDFARAHGADEGINYREGDLKASLKTITGGAGVDVVYDTVGGDLAEQALRATAWKGRYMVVGFAAGDHPGLPAQLCCCSRGLMCAVCSGAGSTMSSRKPAPPTTHRSFNGPRKAGSQRKSMAIFRWIGRPMHLV